MAADRRVHRNGDTHVYVIHTYRRDNRIERDIRGTKWKLETGKCGENWSNANLHYLSLWGLVTLRPFITKNVQFFILQDYPRWWLITSMTVFSFWWGSSPALGLVFCILIKSNLFILRIVLIWTRNHIVMLFISHFIMEDKEKMKLA